MSRVRSDPFTTPLRLGFEYLIRTQNADGSWTEDEITGTGFPKVFYLKYDMYRNAWPLLAFATRRQLVERKRPGTRPEADRDLHTMSGAARNGNGHFPATRTETR